MEPKPLPVVIAEAAAAAESLGAIIAALHERSGAQLDPSVRAGVQGVLDAAGLSESIAAAPPEQIAPVLSLARAVAALVHDFAADPARPPGWAFDDPAILAGMGGASASFPAAFDAVVPSLPGLDVLRNPGGRFLDVGVGVGALALGAAQTWPASHITGIDVWGPSLEEASRRVAAAGLHGRVELREQAVQDMADVDSFDLAWFPGPFIPPGVVRAAVDALLRGIRPGGWIVYSGFAGAGPVGQANADLRAIRAGGVPFSEAEATALLSAAGFVDIRVLPPETWGPGRLVVGQKPA